MEEPGHKQRSKLPPTGRWQWEVLIGDHQQLRPSTAAKPSGSLMKFGSIWYVLFDSSISRVFQGVRNWIYILVLESNCNHMHSAFSAYFRVAHMPRQKIEANSCWISATKECSSQQKTFLCFRWEPVLSSPGRGWFRWCADFGSCEEFQIGFRLHCNML